MIYVMIEYGCQLTVHGEIYFVFCKMIKENMIYVTMIEKQVIHFSINNNEMAMIKKLIINLL